MVLLNKSFTLKINYAMKISSLFLLVTLLCVAITPVSSQPLSGDYQTDSLWFDCAPCTVGSTITVNGIPVSYTGPFWLYPRTNQVHPLDWENQQMSRSPWASWQHIDTTAMRGSTERLTVVQVTDSLGAKHVYSYRINKEPTQIKRVEIYVDSMDAFGPEGFYGPGTGMQRFFPRPEWVWNYSLNGDDVAVGLIERSRIEKSALVRYDSTTITCGVRVSGNSGLNHYNKSLAIVARDVYGNNRFPSLYTSQEPPQKWFKFRSGGSGQPNNFGANEVIRSALNGLHLGDCPIEPVEVYLNGSYWSLAFCQPKIDEYLVEHNYGVNRDSITIASISQFNSVDSNQLNAGIAAGIDTSTFVIVTIQGTPFISKMVDHGDASAIESKIQHLLNQVDSLVFEQGRLVDFVVNRYSIDTLHHFVDVTSLTRYLAAVDFFQLTDAIHNNTAFWAENSYGKIHILARDFDSGMLMHPDSSLWRSLFGKQSQASLCGLLIKFVEQNPEDLILTYQDLTNQHFTCERIESTTAPLVEAIRQGYSKTFTSWGGYPNGGSDTAYQEMRCQQFLTWCSNRPARALTGLANYFMPEMGWDYTDQQQVCFVVNPTDAALGLTITVNSLELDSSWCGMYYPHPCLKVSATVPEGYTLSWLEFPDSAATFRPCIQTTTSITPVLVRNPSSVPEHSPELGFTIAPNPSSGKFRINGKHSTDVCTIYDATGSVIMETVNSEIDLPRPGLYTVKVKNFNKKLVIQ